MTEVTFFLFHQHRRWIHLSLERHTWVMLHGISGHGHLLWFYMRNFTGKLDLGYLWSLGCIGSFYSCCCNILSETDILDSIWWEWQTHIPKGTELEPFTLAHSLVWVNRGASRRLLSRVWLDLKRDLEWFRTSGCHESSWHAQRRRPSERFGSPRCRTAFTCSQRARLDLSACRCGVPFES